MRKSKGLAEEEGEEGRARQRLLGISRITKGKRKKESFICHFAAPPAMTKGQQIPERRREKRIRKGSRGGDTCCFGFSVKEKEKGKEKGVTVPSSLTRVRKGTKSEESGKREGKSDEAHHPLLLLNR